ncbi:endonuclease domain-containing protein [Ferruginibacter sp.]
MEIDGSIHNLADVKNNDHIRQTDLENLGIKVLRFSNEDILYHLEATLERIGNNFK